MKRYSIYQKKLDNEAFSTSSEKDAVLKLSTTQWIDTTQQKVIVWVGMFYNGFTRPVFVKPDVKIDKKYYCNLVIGPALKEFKKLYPNDEYLFYQDSVQPHTSIYTLQFFNDNNLKFIPPQHWLPNSPDATPYDFFLWGHLKSQVNLHKVRTLTGLKKVIRYELKKSQ
ncbi:hypothetical protein ILUMI_07636 [Ignelater luminosus]|uniref:Transposase n=1 Tax=Ignelater luminosus TaxID=2038154 RepID=A0A8K0DD27_IGNLU|nr:hypothetical protein ILUMI_07636 [Ignelater luminosus]